MPTCGACGEVFSKSKDCFAHIQNCPAAKVLKEVVDTAGKTGAVTRAGNHLTQDQILKGLD